MRLEVYEWITWNRHSQALRQAASSPDDTYHTIPVAVLIVLYSQRYKPRTDQLPRESQTNTTNGYFGPQSLNDSNPKEMLTHPNLKDMPTQSTHKTCQPAIGTSRTLPWWLNDTHRWLLLLPRVYSTTVTKWHPQIVLYVAIGQITFAIVISPTKLQSIGIVIAHSPHQIQLPHSEDRTSINPQRRTSNMREVLHHVPRASQELLFTSPDHTSSAVPGVTRHHTGLTVH